MSQVHAAARPGARYLTGSSSTQHCLSGLVLGPPVSLTLVLQGFPSCIISHRVCCPCEALLTPASEKGWPLTFQFRPLCSELSRLNPVSSGSAPCNGHQASAHQQPRAGRALHPFLEAHLSASVPGSRLPPERALQAPLTIILGHSKPQTIILGTRSRGMQLCLRSVGFPSPEHDPALSTSIKISTLRSSGFKALLTAKYPSLCQAEC